MAATTPRARPGNTVQSHLTPGPILLSWAAAATTLTLQLQLTDRALLEADAVAVCSVICSVAQDLGLARPMLDTPTAQIGTMYALVWIEVLATTCFLFPQAPTQMSKADPLDGHRAPLEVPQRTSHMPQHQLTTVDYSYMLLNTLCMPGFFYHYVCLMRAWGFDPAALYSLVRSLGLATPLPAADSVAAAAHAMAAAVPGVAAALALYFMSYELVYYFWHRAMHEVPALYKWVHKHHHQQSYPDRPAIDTLNTGCVESQIGLYLQLGTLWAADKLFGVANVPAGMLFIMAAGCLSVLEHDKFERALPFDFWRADEHHMHHAYVKCNYSPYSSVWDRFFGTHKPFAVKGKRKRAAVATYLCTQSVGRVACPAPLMSDPPPEGNRPPEGDRELRVRNALELPGT